ncbi:hypothetical protein R6Q59_010409 [Mikania micrantha]
MGRGVSSGGGRVLLTTFLEVVAPPSHVPATTKLPSKPAVAITQQDVAKQIPAGIQSSKINNYIRADGENTGNLRLKTWKRYFDIS